MTLVALDNNGDHTWTTPIAEESNGQPHQFDNVPIPVTGPDLPFVLAYQTDTSDTAHHAVAVDNDGNIVWTIDTDGPIRYATPGAVVAGTNIENNTNGQTTAYDPATGTKKWAVEGNPVAAADGHVAVRNQTSAVTATITLHDADTGETVWATNRNIPGQPAEPALLASSDKHLLIDNDGDLHVVRPATQTSTRIAANVGTAQPPYPGADIAYIDDTADTIVFAATAEAVDTTTGQLRWNRDTHNLSPHATVFAAEHGRTWLNGDDEDTATVVNTNTGELLTTDAPYPGYLWNDGYFPAYTDTLTPTALP